MSSGNRHCAMRTRDGNLDCALSVYDLFCVGIQMELDSLPFENFLKLGGDLRVLARNDLRPAVNDGHLARKAAEHLPKFEPDISASEDNQMLGKRRKFHHAFI